MAGQPRLSFAELDQKVTERINRQQILHRESGQPMLWAVIGEGVLRHIVGSRQIMRAQLDRLIDAATLPDVIVQVLPYSAHDHPGTDGPVSVFDFDGKPSVAYTECNRGGMIAESAGPVSALMTTINLIHAAALSPRESLGRLRQTPRLPTVDSSSPTYRHPVHPSSANATSSRPANRASQARRCARSAGVTWPRLASPVRVARHRGC
jgi:Domain of unknown function (DUF5753)